ncbi:hypothetical protein HZH66_006836 [Vespula vulgaris]|uniref:Uncharacterized protein n=1 Tax=Vespula vulgaris TaxID=7454 RepID=A0A834K5X6_VESVU|nr:hypothetical protein HZH66_006836 [Vespula vulgaris]
MSGSAIRWTFRRKERGQVTCKTTRFAKLPFADSPVENDFPRGEGLIENVVRSALAVTEGIMVMVGIKVVVIGKAMRLTRAFVHKE